MRYPVVIHKDPESDYGVTVPDLSGCFSAGETLDEALLEVVEAIECHLEGLCNRWPDVFLRLNLLNIIKVTPIMQMEFGQLLRLI